MEPTKDEDALVDVLDVILRDGAIVRADVVVSIAEIPLVGIKLTAAVAGMETMTEYGLFEEWDASRRKAAVRRRQYDDRPSARLGESGTRSSTSTSIDKNTGTRAPLEHDRTNDTGDGAEEGADR